MSYTVTLEEDEAAEIRRRAIERGYASLEDYLRALIAADALVEALREDWQDAEESPEAIESGLREAWHDAMTGNVLPVETLWDMIDDDE